MGRFCFGKEQRGKMGIHLVKILKNDWILNLLDLLMLIYGDTESNYRIELYIL